MSYVARDLHNAPAAPTEPPAAPQRVFPKARVRRDQIALLRDGLRVTEPLIVIGCGFLASLAYRWMRNWTFESNYTYIILLGGLLVPLVFSQNSAYGRRIGFGTVWSGVTSTAALFATLLVIGFVFRAADTLSRVWLGVWFALVMFIVPAIRLVLVATVRQLQRRGVLRETVALVGATPLARRVAARLNAQNDPPIEVIGVFDDRQERREHGITQIEGTLDDLLELGKRGALDHVVLALPWGADKRIGELLSRLKALAVDVSVCPDHSSMVVLNRPRGELGGLPTLRLAERPLRRWRQLAKRIEDLVLGSLLLAVAAPVMAGAALAIRMDSPGPILFRQRRHGYNNREITVFKFRSMYVDRQDLGGARQTARTDDRITPVGRFLRRTSLDELPQLLNVLRGEMSLVGPRPHPVDMRTNDRLGGEIIDEYAHRHRVKPGITGWAQVNGYRGATTDETALMRRIEYDLDYIDRCSVGFDLKILLMTPIHILSTRNAF